MSSGNSPLHDYQHALAEIRRCLAARKAAVMVGAGFSRNADAIGGSDREFPDWKALTTKLADRLYLDPTERRRVLKEAGATSAAMRLAQEFEVAFTRPALVELVQETIPDSEFVPGKLHRRLMELPWSDVFTTNYDTLLERTAGTIRRRKYDVVRNVADLPIARRPRIVKLHGSLPGLQNLVLTEDDYREYPGEYAPFVNVVQGSLAENVFCLMGFSGNDPNFLAWTGWVRDELDESCPYIYLFTTDHLKSFQRQLLEQRRVIPIPIMGLSEKQAPRDAYEWLFDQLRRPLDPPTANWNIGPPFVISRRDSNVADEPFGLSESKARQWINVALRWRDHRMDYKGWHVLHRLGIERLWAKTDFWLRRLTRKVAESWSPEEAILILHELTWRCAKALVPLPYDVVRDVVDPAVAKYQKWRSDNRDVTQGSKLGEEDTEVALHELDGCLFAIRLELLRHAREIGEHERFQRLLEEVRSASDKDSIQGFADSKHFVEHQAILFLLARLDHNQARRRLRRWDTSDADSVWVVRRVGLCWENELRSLGDNLLQELLSSIRQMPPSRETDYRRLSVEGLALSLETCLHQTTELTRSVRPQTREFRHEGSALEPGDPTRREELSGPVAPDDGSWEKVARGTIERLKDLHKCGCDPTETRDWLDLLNLGDSVDQNDWTESESFDIGRVSWTHSSRRYEELTHARQAVRFIEEAGLPLQIGRSFGLMVAAKLYGDAARTIGSVAPHEAIGLVFRSADAKVLREFLSRKCIASMTPEQMRFLHSAGVQALKDALAHLGRPPARHEPDDDWWERQFEAACVVLGRTVVRLKNGELTDLLEQVVDLQHNERILGRVSGPSELGTLIRRTCESLGRTALFDILPRILDTPVLGSEVLPRNSQQVTGTWQDPVGAVLVHRRQGRRAAAGQIKRKVAALVDIVENEIGEWRKRAVLRVSWLDSVGLVSAEQRRRFTEALFAHTDNYGLPTDTGSYDSLVLVLPRLRGTDEKRLFRSKYIDASEQVADYWDELWRTASRPGPPREPRRRAIRWTASDLDVILARADTWLKDSSGELQSQEDAQHRWRHFFSSQNSIRETYLSWLATIEDVVLLAPNAAERHLKKARNLLRQAEEIGECIAKLTPTLCCQGAMTQAMAVSHIQESLSDRRSDHVWQGCSAIARWCEHTHAGRKPAIPPDILLTLSILVLSQANSGGFAWSVDEKTRKPPAFSGV